MNIKLIVTVCATVVTAVSSAIVTTINTIRTNRTIKKLDEAIGKVGEAASEKVTDVIVNKAIEKAADKHVDEYMQKTEVAVLQAADKNLSIQAKNAVDFCAKDLRKQAAEKISRQVEELDIEQLKKRVCSEAEEHVMEKLDGVLDDSAKKFQDHLDSTQKIFDGISKAMLQKEKEKEDNAIRILLT